MIKKRLMRSFGILCLAYGLSNVAVAESAWVSDQFEVMLRTGPSTSNAIQLMVDSGTELEILDDAAENDYTQVRTAGGTEGWVLSRYLMTEPSAREQLRSLTQQLSSATTDGDSLGSQLSAIRDEYDTASRRIRQLENEKSSLQTEFDETTRKAANTLAIDRQNENLQLQLNDAIIKVGVLEQEKDKLTRESTRTWFIIGAAVLLAGIGLGLVLPRMKFRRPSRYDSF